MDALPTLFALTAKVAIDIVVIEDIWCKETIVNVWATGGHFMVSLSPLITNVPLYIETSQLIYIANQSTGFYMMWNIGR